MLPWIGLAKELPDVAIKQEKSTARDASLGMVFIILQRRAWIVLALIVIT